MSVFVHAQGMKTTHTKGLGVKKWQNSVHVVVECPLRKVQNAIAWIHKYRLVHFDIMHC